MILFLKIYFFQLHNGIDFGFGLDLRTNLDDELFNNNIYISNIRHFNIKCHHFNVHIHVIHVHIWFSYLIN